MNLIEGVSMSHKSGNNKKKIHLKLGYKKKIKERTHYLAGKIQERYCQAKALALKEINDFCANFK
jgi:hypothetical protein